MGVVHSIYDQIGGMAAAGAAVDELYARVLGDPRLAPSFERADVAGRRHRLRLFLVSALGGTRPPTGLELPERDLDRVAGHLAGALRTLGVPSAQVQAILARIASLREEPAAVH
jgi:truncated hemoglobin YjbI